MGRVLKPGGLGIVEFYSKGIRTLKYYFNPWRALKFMTKGGISKEEYLSHGTSNAELDLLLDRKYAITPLIFPFPDLLVKIMGIAAFKRINRIFSNWEFIFLFDQYLAIFKTN